MTSYMKTSNSRYGSKNHLSLNLRLVERSLLADNMTKSIISSITIRMYPKATIDSLKIAIARIVEIMTIGSLMKMFSSHDLTNRCNINCD